MLDETTTSTPPAPSTPVPHSAVPTPAPNSERRTNPRPAINQKQAILSICVLMASVFGVLYYQGQPSQKKATALSTTAQQNSAPQPGPQAGANYESKLNEALGTSPSQLDSRDSYLRAAVADSPVGIPGANARDAFTPAPRSNEPRLTSSRLDQDSTDPCRGGGRVGCEAILVADADRSIKTMSSPLLVMSSRGAYQSTPYLDAAPVSGSTAGADAHPVAKTAGLDNFAHTRPTATPAKGVGPEGQRDPGSLSVNSLPAAYPVPAAPAPQPSYPNTPAGLPDKEQTQAAANHATGPPHKLLEGTILEAVLTNRLNATFAGPVNCMLTTDVWSQNRTHLLLPAGTRVFGEVHRVTGTAQERVAVVFHRLVMPDGFSVSLDHFTGMNQMGETGLKDKINHHYAQIFGISIALGALAGFSSHGTNYGTNTSASEAWRQGFSQSLTQEATQMLDKFLNILPTITVREGTRVKIYLTGDLVLPAYENHRMSRDQ